jgi:hypothetical protein
LDSVFRIFFVLIVLQIRLDVWVNNNKKKKNKSQKRTIIEMTGSGEKNWKNEGQGSSTVTVTGLAAPPPLPFRPRFFPPFGRCSRVTFRIVKFFPGFQLISDLVRAKLVCLVFMWVIKWGHKGKKEISRGCTYDSAWSYITSPVFLSSTKW